VAPNQFEACDEGMLPLVVDPSALGIGQRYARPWTRHQLLDRIGASPSPSAMANTRNSNEQTSAPPPPANEERAGNHYGGTNNGCPASFGINQSNTGLASD